MRHINRRPQISHHTMGERNTGAFQGEPTEILLLLYTAGTEESSKSYRLRHRTNNLRYNGNGFR